jgi:Thiol-disulfide isomerase and thioredoxins
MNNKKLYTALKKNWFNILFVCFFLMMVFSTSAKAWLLQQFISTGLFNTEIKKGVEKDLPAQAIFSFTNLNGLTTSTATLKGKVVFINFWASWCPPCRAEMSSLNNLYSKLRSDTNLIFLFINEDEDQSKGINYLAKNQFAIPFYTSEANVPNSIFSGTLPSTVILNKEGKIILKHEGMAGYNNDAFIRQLKAME